MLLLQSPNRTSKTEVSYVELDKLTKIPHTIDISSAVGITWKTIDDRMNDIPLHVSFRMSEVQLTHLVPRSMARVRPPVWRSRWNFMSMLSRWLKVSRATLRMVLCATVAKMAFRSSPNKVEHTLATPSSYQLRREVDSQPKIEAPAIVQTVVLEVIGRLRWSTMALKKNGTCTLRTLPATSSPRAATTRTLTPVLPLGQTFDASWRRIVQSVVACFFSDTAFDSTSGLTDGGVGGDGGFSCAFHLGTDVEKKESG